MHGQKPQKRERTGQDGSEKADQTGSEARRHHSEQSACPRNGNPEAAEAALSRWQVEKASEAFWDAEQVDHHWTSR
jgi:hypothetical protein